MEAIRRGRQIVRSLTDLALLYRTSARANPLIGDSPRRGVFFLINAQSSHPNVGLWVGLRAFADMLANGEVAP
jgi:hypothetical protein